MAQSPVSGLPIDIPFLRLGDWLVERKLLPSRWRARSQALLLKISESAATLPLELKHVLADRADYQAAKQIRDELAKTTHKSFLGFLPGEAGVWERIVTTYEKQNLHLGETALVLIRNGKHEIPFLRNQISKQQQQLVDFEKRQGDYSKSAAIAQCEYGQGCKSLGIEGENVPHELHNLQQELPQIILSATQRLKAPSVQQAEQYYTDFLNETVLQHEAKPAGTEKLLPIIDLVSQAELHLPASQGSMSHGTPNGSSEAALATTNIVIDTDFVQDPSEASQIDWDIDTQPKDFSLQDAALDNNTNSSEAVEGAGPQDANVLARLVNDSAFRTQLLIELAELTSFLQQRCTELASSAYLTIAAGTRNSENQVSLSTAEKMLADVSDCRSSFTADRIKQLLALKTSARYFNRTCSALQGQAGQESKFTRLIAELEGRKRELQGKLVDDAQRLASLARSTVELKKFAEGYLSKILKQHQVHIVGFPGEISTILQQ